MATRVQKLHAIATALGKLGPAEFPALLQELRRIQPTALQTKGSLIGERAIRAHLKILEALEFVDKGANGAMSATKITLRCEKVVDFQRGVFDACKERLSDLGVSYEDLVTACHASSPAEQRTLDGLTSKLKPKSARHFSFQFEDLLVLLTEASDLSIRNISVYEVLK